MSAVKALVTENELLKEEVERVKAELLTTQMGSCTLPPDFQKLKNIVDGKEPHPDPDMVWTTRQELIRKQSVIDRLSRTVAAQKKHIDELVFDAGRLP